MNISVPVRVWLTIDATLDNHAAVAAQTDGNPGPARHLRELGWAANAQHPLRGKGSVGWPPNDSAIHLDVSEGDAMFIRDVLLTAHETVASILESGLHEDMRLDLHLLERAQRAWTEAVS